MDIGTQLKKRRLALKWTQEQVAEKIHVSRQTISNWENGHSYPDIVSVILLSDFYEVSLDALLKGDQKMVYHLQTSTNVVKSNRLIFLGLLLNVLLIVMLMFSQGNQLLIIILFTMVILNSANFMYQIIKKI
ncbi:helix-turn-helix domain-containing protein [Isobaculum melis]|uniref:Helix-turn-helix n=1 Tax=Isobaculum melis TaxID=142588 RepID=A0A1H9UAY3_9LACT|nr:helix-turn-helix transcriptional regulator [Isobaculum melis]SES06327.1 Helix-turn-helix [Isobaculum melis]